MSFRYIFLGLLLALSVPGAASAAAYVVTVDFGTAPENFGRFKAMMETGEIPTTEGQPSCRESED